MKIILNQDVVNLGEEGDVVVVKDGYARNYLLPTGAAVLYNKTNAAIFASRAAQIEKRKAEKRAQSASMKEKLDATVLNLVVPAGESGKLFGSVTSVMVQDALAKQGIEVATHAIKMVGTYSVIVHLYENEFSHVKLIVESEEMVRERKAAEARAEEEARAKAEAEAAAAAAAAAAQVESVAQEVASEEIPVVEEAPAEESN